MPAHSRYIRARVVGPVEFAGDADAVVSGPRKKLTRAQKRIRRLLRKARALKRRISRLRARKSPRSERALERQKSELRAVMAELKAAGWKPKKPTRALKPGEDEMDAALEDIPEPEPGESDDDPELDAPDAPEDAAEGNWLDGHVGAVPWKRGKLAQLWKKASRPLAVTWSDHVPLGDSARLQTRRGQRAMVATVSPGLYIVQVVSDAAAQKVAGDNVGILPLVLYPIVKSKVLQKLAPQHAAAPATPPAPGAPPAASASPTSAGDVGCDRSKWSGS